MIASFLAIFVAFAVCQALLTVKFADFLSSERTSGRSTVAPTGDVASANCVDDASCTRVIHM